MPPGSFVGRERELAELRAGLADVTAGRSHLFLLSGEPGIGKTRLADEFRLLAVARGVREWPGVGAGKVATRRHIGRGSKSFAPVWLTPTPSSAQQFSARRRRRKSRRILRSFFPTHAS